MSLPAPGFDSDSFDSGGFDTGLALDISAPNSGVTGNREGENWWKCDRCDWYYPQSKMVNQNGLNLCKGVATHDCYDLPGHAAEMIDLDIPYEQRPEPLPFEDEDL